MLYELKPLTYLLAAAAAAATGGMNSLCIFSEVARLVQARKLYFVFLIIANLLLKSNHSSANTAV